MDYKIQNITILLCGFLVLALFSFSGIMIPAAYAMDDMSSGMGLHHAPESEPREPLPPFAAKVADFYLDGGSSAGETVTFVLEVSTSGAGSRPVPWVVYARDRLNGTTHALVVKTTPDVSAGASFAEKIPWKALPGTFEFFAYVDPQQSLGETLEEQRDNRSKTVSRQFSDWLGWAEAFQPEIQSSVRLWIADATIGGFTVAPERISYNRSNSSLLPDYVATGVMNAVSESWMKWARSIEVPVIASGGSVPLSSLRQTAQYLEPTHLAGSIKSQVGPASEWLGNEAAIENISGSIYRMFDEWRLRAVVIPDGKGRYKFDGVFGN